MKAFAIVALFVVGAAANYGGGYSQSSSSAGGYGGSSGGYGGSSRSAIPITRFNQEVHGSDSNNVEYETGNGIRQSESTRVVQGRGGSYMDAYGQMAQSTATVVKSGTVSYTSPEGQQIHLNWQADENGFRATGDHLPTPPPIPAEIAASLRGNGYGGGYSQSNAGGYSQSSSGGYSAPMRSGGYSAPMRSGGY